MAVSQSTTPREIHGYKVIEPIGEGAASRLYVVSDPRSRSLHALKHVTARGVRDRRFLAQVEREFEVGSKVDHPAVRSAQRLLRYREIVRTSELALILDFVDGVPLDAATFEDTAAMFRCFATVADGLRHLHEVGYAHADLKPGNILVGTDGRGTIIDLGQACRLGERKTRIQGTPGFLAPEQAALGAIDERTDAFLLGATMYRCLTGRYASSEMMDNPTPAPPLRRLCPDLPDAAEEIVQTCLEPAQARRPGDLGIVAERLRVVADACGNEEPASRLRVPA
jgi:serine/threonine protein kinase